MQNKSDNIQMRYIKIFKIAILFTFLVSCSSNSQIQDQACRGVASGSCRAEIEKSEMSRLDAHLVKELSEFISNNSGNLSHKHELARELAKEIVDIRKEEAEKTGEVVGDQYFTMGVEPLKAAICLLYTSPSPRDQRGSRMPSSA